MWLRQLRTNTLRRFVQNEFGLEYVKYFVQFVINRIPKKRQSVGETTVTTERTVRYISTEEDSQTTVMTEQSVANWSASKITWVLCL